MTANPEHSTCPKWAAREARRIALEEAAALCEAYAKGDEAWLDPHIAELLACAIRALAKEPG